MATIIPSLPFNLTNGTTADASQVMADFNAIVAAVNANAANSGVNTNINQIVGLTTPLSVNQGGIGLNSIPANSVMIGEGTSNINVAAPGTAGNVLMSNGASVDPSFQNLNLGTMSAQNANAVAITGGTISGVTLTGHASLDLLASNNLTDVASRPTAMSNLLVAMTAGGLGSLAIAYYNSVTLTFTAGSTYTGAAIQAAVGQPWQGSGPFGFPYGSGSWLCLGLAAASVGGWGGFDNFQIILFVRTS